MQSEVPTADEKRGKRFAGQEADAADILYDCGEREGERERKRQQSETRE